MTSFHKTSYLSGKINGTKLKNGLPCISTGIPSLDHIIGSCLPCGTIFMLEEDMLRNYSRVLSKYFLAEGVVCKHSLLIASLDDNPEELVKELPVPTAGDQERIAAEEMKKEDDKMRIAWRYESQGPVDSSFGSNTSFGHHFDLSKHMSDEDLKNIDVEYWSGGGCGQNKEFKGENYLHLLKKIKHLVSKPEYQLSSKAQQNVLRISISSFGSPSWTAHETDCYRPAPLGGDMLKFLYCLRILLRDTTAVAFVTVPKHILEEDSLASRLRYSADHVIGLESFAGSARETNPVFKEYHGLLHVVRLRACHTLAPHVPPGDLAFKLRRKRFLIEKLHLPPELEDSSEREQDDITATPTCGGFKKKDIDF